MSIATEFDNLTTEELRDALFAFQFRLLRVATILSERCGDPFEAARHIRLAMALPPSVLLREAKRALETVEADGEPSISEIAALIARQTATVQMIEATLARRHAAVTLQ
jgi:hypothetical protein